MMGKKYLKRFSITDKVVSMEELRTFFKMERLVYYSPIPYFSDGVSFLMNEICEKELYYSDILWAEGINSKQSVLHMKNGQQFTVPFGIGGLRHFISNAIDTLFFVQISRFVFVSLTRIKQVSRTKLYLKDSNMPLIIGRIYFKPFYFALRDYLESVQD